MYSRGLIRQARGRSNFHLSSYYYHIDIMFISDLDVVSSEETRIPIPSSAKLNLIDRLSELFDLQICHPQVLNFIIDSSIVGVESCT